jgi:hypothetical protein
VCRLHSRISPAELAAFFATDGPPADWRDRVSCVVCLTCSRAEIWAGRAAAQLTDEERRRFLATEDAQPLVGVFEMMKRWA